jgi:putative transcriptional regulator
MISILPKKGHLLIAEPILGDIFFNRSVILLAEYNKEGAVGFILNKPLKLKLSDLIPEIKISFKIFNGGPVEQDNIYFIHNVPELIFGSIEIADGIFWGGDFKIAIRLINDKIISKKNIRFFLGYSGWDKNQLDRELKENLWIINPNDLKSNVLSKSTQYFWKEKIMEQGGDYILYSNAPEDPNLN